MDDRLAHVRNQVEHCLATIFNRSIESIRLQETTNGWSWECHGSAPVTFQVHSSKGLPELLISATVSCETAYPPNDTDPLCRVAWLRDLQSNPLVRLQFHDLDSNAEGVVFKRSAEVYAGGKEVLISCEVDDIYRRISGWGSEDDTPREQRAAIINKIQSLCQENSRVSIREQSVGCLIFTFHHEGRQQLVEWDLSGSHAVMSSVVLDDRQTLALAGAGKADLTCSLITHTLKRNVEFDLVDFHVDHLGRLTVRACHPVAHLNREELAFIACSVASEADRLEQILLGLVESH